MPASRQVVIRCINSAKHMQMKCQKRPSDYPRSHHFHLARSQLFLSYSADPLESLQLVRGSVGAVALQLIKLFLSILWLM